MEKPLTFSTEQKKLIWTRFVEPQNGTKAESDQFIEVCETFGLNPLVNDIVFQKYGNRVNFITTRDGLLRVASRQEGYVGAPIANVVKEGDEFEFIPSKGEVFHKFGQKRGAILGAYAVMHHAKFKPVAVFVDFDEYFNANSSLKRGGKGNVWDTMPSAMIVKIAEVFVLRRQFPLGGLYTREEMAIDDQAMQDDLVQSNGKNSPVPQTSDNPFSQNTNSNQSTTGQEQGNNQSESFLSKEQANELHSIIMEISKVRNVGAEKITAALGKPIIGFKDTEFNSVKEKLMGWLEQANQENQSPDAVQPTENQSNVEQENTKQGQPSETPAENVVSDTFILTNKEEGKAPNGQEFIKIYVEGIENPIFTREPGLITQVKGINNGDSFKGEIKHEYPFTFLVSIGEIQKVNQTA